MRIRVYDLEGCQLRRHLSTSGGEEIGPVEDEKSEPNRGLFTPLATKQWYCTVFNVLPSTSRNIGVLRPALSRSLLAVSDNTGSLICARVGADIHSFVLAPPPVALYSKLRQMSLLRLITGFRTMFSKRHDIVRNRDERRRRFFALRKIAVVEISGKSAGR